MSSERPFAHKSTTRSRREAERRAAATRAAYEAAIRKPAPSVTTPVTKGSKKVPKKLKKINNVTSVKPPKEAKEPSPGRRLSFYGIAFTLTALATVMLGAPILGQETNWKYLGVGIAVSLMLFERVWHWTPLASTGVRTFAIGFMVLMSIFFTVGVLNQVEIDGKAYPVWSDTAKAYTLSEEIYADLLIIRENDRYLELPSEQARTYSNEIKIATTTSLEIANKWNPSVERELPNEEFLVVLRDINAAADAQAQALDLLSQDLLQPDVSRQSNISTKRAASVESVTDAILYLRQATGPYGFDPIISKGPVE